MTIPEEEELESEIFQWKLAPLQLVFFLALFCLVNFYPVIFSNVSNGNHSETIFLKPIFLSDILIQNMGFIAGPFSEF